MAGFSVQGWLPAEIYLDNDPHIVPDAQVRWLEVGDRYLAEPFLDQTFSDIEAAKPPPKVVNTDLDTLIHIGRRLPAVRPAGMIFHVSHCGSTLVANILKTAAGAVVVAESHAISRLLRRFVAPPGNYLAERWNLTRKSILEALFAVYASYRTGAPEPLVIKCTSIDILSLSVVRGWWPDVPCIILVRDPIEVIVGKLAGGWWKQLKANPPLTREILGWKDPSSETMSDEEYCARLVAEFLTLARADSGPDCQVIDYEDLDVNRVRQIANLFQLALPDDDQTLAKNFSWYSKDPARALQFRDDRAEKRRLATPSVVDAAQKWAMPLYRELRG